MLPHKKMHSNNTINHTDSENSTLTNFVYHLTRFNTLQGIFKNQDLPTEINQNIKEQSNTLPNQKITPIQINILQKKTKMIKKQEKSQIQKKKQQRKMKNVTEIDSNNYRRYEGRKSEMTSNDLLPFQKGQTKRQGQKQYYQEEQDICLGLQQVKRDHERALYYSNFKLQQKQRNLLQENVKVCHHIESYDYFEPYRLKDQLKERHEEHSVSNQHKFNESFSHTESYGKRNSRIRRQEINMRYQSPEERRQKQIKNIELYQQLMNPLFKETLQGIDHEQLTRILQQQLHIDFPQNQPAMHYISKQETYDYPQHQQKKEMLFELSSIKQNIKEEDNLGQEKQDIKQNKVDKEQMKHVQSKQQFELAINFYNQEDNGFHFQQNVQDQSYGDYDNYLGYNYLSQ